MVHKCRFVGSFLDTGRQVVFALCSLVLMRARRRLINVSRSRGTRYRIFNTVRRCVEKHPVSSYYHRPHAEDSSRGGGGDRADPYGAENTAMHGVPKGVEVWCSNDYLAASMHPEVVQAVADVVLGWMA